jgi:hypothetical protein
VKETGSIMTFSSKYQDNQTAEPVKIKTSFFRNLDRTCILIEKVFTRENHRRRKLICTTVVRKWGVAKKKSWKLSRIIRPTNSQISFPKI